jgi:Sec-independent protein translocase protein TatA
MEILGIGPLELLFILLIALVVLGPKDMVKAGRTLGKLLRKIVMSPTWHTFQRASQDLRHLPNRLIREAGLDELEQDVKDIRQATDMSKLQELDRDIKNWQDDISTWTTPPENENAHQLPEPFEAREDVEQRLEPGNE